MNLQLSDRLQTKILSVNLVGFKGRAHTFQPDGHVSWNYWVIELCKLIKVYAAIDLYYDGEAFEIAGFRKQTNSQEHQGTNKLWLQVEWHWGLSHKVHTSVVRFFDSGRNLLFQTAQSELRTSSVSFTLHPTKMNSYINM